MVFALRVSMLLQVVHLHRVQTPEHHRIWSQGSLCKNVLALSILLIQVTETQRGVWGQSAPELSLEARPDNLDKFLGTPGSHVEGFWT